MDIHVQTMIQTQKELGILRTEMDQVKSDVKEVKADLKIVLKKLDEREGGSKLLAKFLFIASSIGGIIGTLVTLVIKSF